MDIILRENLKDVSEALLIGLHELGDLNKHPLASVLSETDRRFAYEALTGARNWSEKSTRIMPLPSRPHTKLIIMGLGERKQWNSRKAMYAARRAIVLLKEAGARHGVVHIKDFTVKGFLFEETVRMVSENVTMADFVFTKFKTPPPNGWPNIGVLEIVVPRATQKVSQALQEGVIVGQEVNNCRVLANTPGGDMTPKKLAEAARREHRKYSKKLHARVLDEKAMAKLGMGGVLGVGRGSAERPRFIILEYLHGAKSRKPIVFVGKGVTFDTGGLNLKPEAGIYEMHMDMSGGAAVIHAMSAIARLGLKTNIIGLVPAVENMPSGSSYHPGDILKTITGKTIEVLNTDAEGRIILADALGYAQRYSPELIVDAATLTGAAMVALGQRVIGLFTQDKKLEAMARDAGERSGDLVWPLPLWDEYADDIQGTFGDVANMGKTRYGGASTGAIFLRQFVGDYPWMHLDIAPTMTTIEGQYLAKGASGTGVRFFVEIARRYASR